MSNGIEIQNDAGSVVIDGEYVNYTVHKTGTYTISSTGIWEQVTISISRDSPQLLFVKPGASWVTFMYMKESGGAYTEVGFKVRGTASETIDYALCDATFDNIDDTDHGIQVFDSAGDVVYDSRAPYMTVDDISVVSGVSSYSLDTTYDISHANTPDAYYLLNSISGHAEKGGGGTSVYTDFYYPMIRQSADDTMELYIGWLGIRIPDALNNDNYLADPMAVMVSKGF